MTQRIDWSRRPGGPPPAVRKYVSVRREFDFVAKANMPVAWDDDALTCASRLLPGAEKELRGKAKALWAKGGTPDIAYQVWDMPNDRAEAIYTVRVA